MLRTEHRALACGGSTNTESSHDCLSSSSQSSAGHQAELNEPLCSQHQLLGNVRRAAASRAGDSKRTALQSAHGVQSNFYQNESKSWFLQHLTFNKQANMPSLSAGTGAALGKQ